ncbi:helix-turn-helix domain-containing protein [Pseudooceanicola aestuarii]|uniref:helix-turn-helix domain-containing protein n=1 Tax=Pseudooceanicola aestuarii TaxID=2697319 RepID=UPI001EF80FBE|nr:helix-turn-helix domain-containing protein [Pseudooceanicola aestuarii]
MDGRGFGWYFSGMRAPGHIPVFNLFGETGVFPDVIHVERILDRAGLHDWVISPHRHAQMSQVFHIEHGTARVVLDGAEARLGAGDYLFVPPQVVHGFEFSRGTEGGVLSLPGPVVARLGPKSGALSGWLAGVRRGAVTPALARLIGEIAQAYAGAGTFRAQMLVALTHALLAALAEDGASRDAASPGPLHQMRKLDNLIARHGAAGWRARDYADALRITPGHLNRIVRRATGASLGAHIETVQMTEACRLIAFTRLPLAEVGYRLGYADPSYFSRRFRMRMGETPSGFRARVSGR